MTDFPGVITLAYNSEDRLGMFWYRPETKVMAFSSDSRSHFHLENFPIVKDFHGWIRGFVFKKDKTNYILIYKGDLGDRIIHDELLEDVHHLAEAMCRTKISGFFDESGCNLLKK